MKLGFLAAVAVVIELKPTGLRDRIDKDCWRTADRPHGGDQMPSRHARDLRADLRQAGHRQMIEHAVKAKSEIDEGVRFRQSAPQICDLKCQADAGKAGESARHPSRGSNRKLSDIKATRGDRGESEQACVRNDAAQPCTEAAPGVENAERARTGGSQRAQFGLEERPEAPIRISVRTFEREQIPRITNRIGDIVVTGPIVDGSDVVSAKPVHRQIRPAKLVVSMHHSAPCASALTAEVTGSCVAAGKRGLAHSAFPSAFRHGTST
jgi:hypothetical protein